MVNSSLLTKTSAMGAGDCPSCRLAIAFVIASGPAITSRRMSAIRWGASFSRTAELQRATKSSTSNLIGSRSLNSEHPCSLRLALQVPGELAEAVEILRRTVDVAVVELGGGAESPEGVDQVWPCQRNQVGAPGGEDRVGVVGFVDVADGHGRELAFVADAVAERRLEHAAVDWL